jgi:hypothetical protein
LGRRIDGLFEEFIEFFMEREYYFVLIDSKYCFTFSKVRFLSFMISFSSAISSK